MHRWVDGHEFVIFTGKHLLFSGCYSRGGKQTVAADVGEDLHNPMGVQKSPHQFPANLKASVQIHKV